MKILTSHAFKCVLYWYWSLTCGATYYVLNEKSKNFSNDQELVQSEPKSYPQTKIGKTK